MSERKLSFDDITRKTGRFNVRFRWLLIAIFLLLSVIAAIAPLYIISLCRVLLYPLRFDDIQF